MQPLSRSGPAQDAPPAAPGVFPGWWRQNRRALAFGLAAGVMWGFLTAGSVVPRDPLVYDVGQGVVIQYREGAAPLTFPAERFMADYNAALIQLTLIFLVVCGAAGWATWQLTRIRPRGEDQPPLRAGLDWYLVSLAMGGFAAVLAFRQLSLAHWFQGPELSPAAAASVVVEVLLPLYAGLALFLVWLMRLKTIRAPDWETHYPKPVRRRRGLLGRKGGDSTDT